MSNAQIQINICARFLTYMLNKTVVVDAQKKPFKTFSYVRFPAYQLNDLSVFVHFIGGVFVLDGYNTLAAQFKPSCNENEDSKCKST